MGDLPLYPTLSSLFLCYGLRIGIGWGRKRKKGDEDPVVMTQTGSVYAMAKFGAL